MSDIPTNGRLLESIVQSSDDAIYSKTLDGIITSWNPAAVRLYHYLPDEIIGQNVKVLAPDDRYKEYENDILRRVGRGEKVDHEVTERLTKDGRIVRVAITVSPLRNEDGAVVGASVIAHEVSVGERQLSEMRALVAQAITEASESRMLQKRVHDLKGQLAVVAGNLELVSEGLEEFVTGEDIERRLVELEDRVDKRSKGRQLKAIVIGFVIAAALAGGFAGAARFTTEHATEQVRRETRERAIDGCERRNASNQVIRDIIERSQSQQDFDPTKLSPDTRRILVELQAAAPAAGDPASFRTFVFSKTQLQDCSKLPKP